MSVPHPEDRVSSSDAPVQQTLHLHLTSQDCCNPLNHYTQRQDILLHLQQPPKRETPTLCTFTIHSVHKYLDSDCVRKQSVEDCLKWGLFFFIHYIFGHCTVSLRPVPSFCCRICDVHFITCTVSDGLSRQSILLLFLCLQRTTCSTKLSSVTLFSQNNKQRSSSSSSSSSWSHGYRHVSFAHLQL